MKSICLRIKSLKFRICGEEDREILREKYTSCCFFPPQNKQLSFFLRKHIQKDLDNLRFEMERFQIPDVKIKHASHRLQAWPFIIRAGFPF